MAPSKVSAATDNTTFLLSCLVNIEKLPWDQIAVMNSITGTDAVPAGRAAQRKFKKLVDASGKFVLDGGKVLLKDQITANEDDNDDAASTGETTTPQTTPAKKRGRPVGSTKSATKSNKKPKVAKKEETTEGDDEEAN